MKNASVIRSIMILLLTGFSVSVSGVSLLSGEASVSTDRFSSAALTIKANEIIHASKVLSLDDAKPGDCLDKSVEIYLSGTKPAYIRLIITETWSNYYQDGLYIPGPTVYTPSNAPLTRWYLDDEPVNWPHDNAWQYHNGYWYYIGLLDPEESGAVAHYRILSRICLDDTVRPSQYQDASWSLAISVEAVQVDEDVLFAKAGWGVAYLDDANENIKGWYPVSWHSGGSWQLTAGSRIYVWQKTNSGEANYLGWVLQPQP